MKMILALALLSLSTVSMANSINALISNDVIVKSVLKGIETKNAMKCAALNIVVEEYMFTASTMCLTVDNSDGLESAVMVEIIGLIDGEAKEATVTVQTINLNQAG